MDNEVAGPSAIYNRVENDREPGLRSVYLITYSKADLSTVHTRECFRNFVLEAFHSTNKDNKVLQYAVCRERHMNGHLHNHMCLKLKKQRKWKSVRKYLDEIKGIKVNFQDGHANYYGAYSYVCKEDANVLLSEAHPNLSHPPRTVAATTARRQRTKQCVRVRKFDELDLSNIILKNNKTRSQLLAFTKNMKDEGERALPTFIIKNIDQSVKIMRTTWEMEESVMKEKRSRKSLIEILKEASLGSCKIENCKWLMAAFNTLSNNNVQLIDFCQSIRLALEKGRGKKRNIMIVGPSNCGKTFMLKPLTNIFDCFSNPATGSFAWIGVEEKEVIYLNDFRWSKTIIAWSDFLRLLEGDEVHFPAPKTHYTNDIKLSKESITPVFSTSIKPISRNGDGEMGYGESIMMQYRWKVFSFHHQISVCDMIDIEPCTACFANLILQHSDSDCEVI